MQYVLQIWVVCIFGMSQHVTERFPFTPICYWQMGQVLLRTYYGVGISGSERRPQDFCCVQELEAD